ncbi:hypothetical protein [Glaciimonas immobilis]|uniref:Uncharacterized protein n=1 Tax=Glaciimonas immobilis TaxID=728004 RepID=A0A840S011_9BURK|nr:hypothetical protein [Glaciimonas immobilis]KAF3995969.1 hypothetical protein HAV38_20905 [Glaciimonas immobilis]MBB5202436.1 hypothetical protein [Glaciimonas immobilis]
MLIKPGNFLPAVFNQTPLENRKALQIDQEMAVTIMLPPNAVRVQVAV